ncbi:MAG TPA: O-antigen ligase family protein [Magnetospirillum sp.]|nr:O-antigen ligase family protein [Magnetospirillum sp.]
MSLAEAKAKLLRWDESNALALGTFVAPTLAIYAALGLAPLYAVVLLGMVLVAIPARPWRHFSRSIAIPLLGFCLLGAVSTLWAVDRLQTIRTALTLTIEFGLGAMLVVQARRMDEDGRRRVGSALAAGMILALVCLLLEKLTPGLRFLFHKGPPLQGNVAASSLQRSETVLTIFLLPLLAYWWQAGRRRLAVAYLAIFVLAIYSGTSLAARLALPCGLLLALAHQRFPRLARGALVTMVVGIIAAQPLWSLLPEPQVTMDRLHKIIPNSAHHRMTIWRFGATMTLERPLFGWGLDGARAIPGGDDEIPIDVGGGIHMHEQQMPLHPHNGALQWWLELGAAGAVLAGAFLVAVILAAARLPGLAGSAALGSMGAGMIVLIVSYGVWQSWWQGALWLAAAAAAALAPPGPAKR